MCDDHPWKLTAPWWRWPKLGTPNRDVRRLPPALQMYDSSDPVTTFVKDPQKALAYGDDDVVTAYAAVATSGKRSTLSPVTLTTPTPVTRKVFLPMHKRFYLVVCELHCDTPGFPVVARDKVCEAGMVIRRRRLAVADEYAPQALEILKSIGVATARIATLDRTLEKRVLKKRRPRNGGGTAVAVKSKIDVAMNQAALAEKERLEAELLEARAQLLEWKSASGATVLKEGWVASSFENVGAWQVTDEKPGDVQEVTYPLYPLVPDPRNPGHDGAGKTIWFGMVPTGTREVDGSGAARFDDDSRYEVRCFVRRHRCDCPRTGEKNDCGGELVWSEPTEVFQIAGHFDPVGSGNHPVTIQMPDIPALAAAASAGKAKLPVQMKFPVGSRLGFNVDPDEIKASDPTTNSMPQICFFAIPLITIVATFVLNIFLPIVVFLFQLWFMLGLKFCIPPSLSVAVGLDGQVNADIQLQLELAASFDVAIDLSAGVNLDNALAASLNLAVLGDAHASVNDTTHVVTPGGGFSDTPGVKMTNTVETSALLDLNDALTDDRTDEVESGSVVAGLAFVPRVERSEVAA